MDFQGNAPAGSNRAFSPRHCATAFFSPHMQTTRMIKFEQSNTTFYSCTFKQHYSYFLCQALSKLTDNTASLK